MCLQLSNSVECFRSNLRAAWTWSREEQVTCLVYSYIACSNDIHGLPHTTVHTVHIRPCVVLCLTLRSFWRLWGPCMYQPCIVSMSTENMQLQGRGAGGDSAPHTPSLIPLTSHSPHPTPTPSTPHPSPLTHKHHYHLLVATHNASCSM